MEDQRDIWLGPVQNTVVVRVTWHDSMWSRGRLCPQAESPVEICGIFFRQTERPLGNWGLVGELEMSPRSLGPLRKHKGISKPPIPSPQPPPSPPPTAIPTCHHHSLRAQLDTSPALDSANASEALLNVRAIIRVNRRCFPAIFPRICVPHCCILWGNNSQEASTDVEIESSRNGMKFETYFTAPPTVPFCPSDSNYTPIHLDFPSCRTSKSFFRSPLTSGWGAQGRN